MVQKINTDMMKTLQGKLTGMLLILLAIIAALVSTLLYDAWESKVTSNEFKIRSHAAGLLNQATAVQAVERGMGSLLIASGDPELIEKFETLGTNGDSYSIQAISELEESKAASEDPQLSKLIRSVNEKREIVTESRNQVINGNTDVPEWMRATTDQIFAEFELRDALFLPKTPGDQIIHLNSVIRSNIALLAEYAGRERAILSSVIPTQESIPEETLNTLNQYRAIVDQSTGKIMNLKQSSDLDQGLLSAIDTFEKVFLKEYEDVRKSIYRASTEATPYPLTGTEWINEATRAIDTAIGVSEAVGDVSSKAADKLRAESQRNLYLMIVVLLVSMGVFGLIYRYIKNNIVKPLNEGIMQLSTASTEVGSASSQVSDSSQSLAESNSEQAAGIQQTSASLEEISSQIKQTAGNATDVESKMNTTKPLVEKGVKAMRRMADAMQEIKESSKKMSDIISTIDNIAFQTNLLALNAAVEAARAGESGKGFAVVAEEVRNLAQRSAQAAQNTAGLIENSQQNTGKGEEVANEVSHSLDQIADSIGEIFGLITEISAATQEQSSGVEEMNSVMSEMDRAIQSNASTAEESASAAEELSSQAVELNLLVQSMTKLIGTESPIQLSGLQKQEDSNNKHTRLQNTPVKHSDRHLEPAYV